MNTDKPQNLDAPMPAFLKRVSLGTSIVLVALALTISWWWGRDTAWATLVAFVLIVLAAPPISTIVVLEVANYISRGELKRTGKMKS